MLTPDERELARTASSLWWVGIVTGILFCVLAFVILSYSARSLAVLSVLIGVSFCFTGVGWLVQAALVEELRWLAIVCGVLGLVAGVVAFVYPGETLRVLSLIIGWFMLLAGVLDVVSALTHRSREGWWLSLASGVVMFGLGAWAVGETDRSVILLVTIVGVYSLIRGIATIVSALALRRLGRDLNGPGGMGPLAPA